MRKQFELLPDDKRFLDEYGCPWEAIQDGSPWVILHSFPTHDGYNHQAVSIAIRLDSGYPDVQLDMVYVYPFLGRKDGRLIKATDARQQIDGKEWQRWSRHRTPTHPWLPGVDSLETHITCIEEWFQREFENDFIPA